MVAGKGKTKAKNKGPKVQTQKTARKMAERQQS